MDVKRGLIKWPEPSNLDNHAVPIKLEVLKLKKEASNAGLEIQAWTQLVA